MIDFIKVYVFNLHFKVWLSNSLLPFNEENTISVSNGEVIQCIRVAEYKSLKFFIIQSKKDTGKYYCIVTGSLHKYYNNGIHNANDFTFENLQTVIQELKEKFSIDLSQANIKNIEFGVNFSPPISAKKVIQDVLVHRDKSFDTYTVKRVNTGKKIERQQYEVKLYDKGKQYKKVVPVGELVRFEIKVTRMQFLRKSGIVTLADLQDISKFSALKNILLSCWDNIIYHDKKQMVWRDMKPHEQKKFLYYGDKRNWDSLTPNQRNKAKNRFNVLVSKYSVTDYHGKIGALIGSKWDELEAGKWGGFNHDSGAFEAEKWGGFNHLDYMLIHPHLLNGTNQEIITDNTLCSNINNSIPIENQKILDSKSQNNNNTYPYFARNPTKNELSSTPSCRTCKKDISHKQVNAVYCTKKCNNSYHATIRKMNRAEQKRTQTEILDSLMDQIEQTNLTLSITYGNDKEKYTDTLEQKEIQILPEILRKISKVVILSKSKDLTLTSYKARYLIKTISSLNKD